jgi:DNA repair protein RecN (Recombination protein N)
MLTYLQIRDFAIVEAVELEFKPGLTALTGETGAGKSIIVDALLLAAGGRATAESLRHGAERAEITATFDVRGHGAAREWLAAQDIECDGDCVLRRMLAADGRGRAFINGQLAPLQSLRALGELLLDIHGQQEFQSLTRRTAQRRLLDAHGGHETKVAEVRAAYTRFNALQARLEELNEAGRDREARLELLRYQVQELQALALQPGEVPELLAEHKRLSNSGRLAEGVTQALGLLYEEESFSAHAAVSRAQTVLRALLPLDERLEGQTRLLDESAIALREAAGDLRHYLDRMDIDPRRQDQVERRIAGIDDLARKHRLPPGELPAQLTRLEEELQRLEAHAVEVGATAEQMDAARKAYSRAAAALGTARQAAATDLSSTVTTLMQKLGMPGGQFQVDVAQDREPGPDGNDTVEFLVSANPGQPVKPLAKVASGGELSRISLAVQVAAAHTALTPCLVFDEVDAGVGGAVAEIVGRQLRALGEHAQVLCVTHLPQVASQAHHQLRVTKLTDGRTTRTAIGELTPEERIEELARMLGGVKITDKTRDHAREMLQVNAPGAGARKKARPQQKKKA